ncbi:hypothetical protein [Thermomonospora amylolytica]|uniref:hypothetical protein n=1 Tax=Thermomonospora amylolytica TaxID=1411117 RepID=UPI000E6B80B2|nr:hypothetical protein [Thermomonospora amylolytica]
MATIVAPTRTWQPPERTPQQTIADQLGELNAQYPDALAWHAPCGTWRAAPTGATRIIEAPTAAALAAKLAEHYRQMISQQPPATPPTPRPARQSAAPRPGGAADGAVVRSTPPHPVASRTTAPTTPPAAPHRPRHRTPRDQYGRFRSWAVSLGLIHTPQGAAA